MSNEKSIYKRVYKKLIFDTLKSMIIATLVLVSLLVVFHSELSVSTPSLITGLLGTIMIFVGGSFLADASGRWGTHKLPQYKHGLLLQTIGLGFVVFALIVK